MNDILDSLKPLRESQFAVRRPPVHGLVFDPIPFLLEAPHHSLGGVSCYGTWEASCIGGRVSRVDVSRRMFFFKQVSGGDTMPRKGLVNPNRGSGGWSDSLSLSSMGI